VHTFLKKAESGVNIFSVDVAAVAQRARSSKGAAKFETVVRYRNYCPGDLA
jgi:hypothetical protein